MRAQIIGMAFVSLSLSACLEVANQGVTARMVSGGNNNNSSSFRPTFPAVPPSTPPGSGQVTPNPGSSANPSAPPGSGTGSSQNPPAPTLTCSVQAAGPNQGQTTSTVLDGQVLEFNLPQGQSALPLFYAWIKVEPQGAASPQWFINTTLGNDVPLTSYNPSSYPNFRNMAPGSYYITGFVGDSWQSSTKRICGQFILRVVAPQTTQPPAFAVPVISQVSPTQQGSDFVFNVLANPAASLSSLASARLTCGTTSLNLNIADSPYRLANGASVAGRSCSLAFTFRSGGMDYVVTSNVSMPNWVNAAQMSVSGVVAMGESELDRRYYLEVYGNFGGDLNQISVATLSCASVSFQATARIESRSIGQINVSFSGTRSLQMLRDGACTIQLAAGGSSSNAFGFALAPEVIAISEQLDFAPAMDPSNASQIRKDSSGQEVLYGWQWLTLEGLFGSLSSSRVLHFAYSCSSFAFVSWHDSSQADMVTLTSPGSPGSENFLRTWVLRAANETAAAAAGAMNCRFTVGYDRASTLRRHTQFYKTLRLNAAP